MTKTLYESVGLVNDLPRGSARYEYQRWTDMSKRALLRDVYSSRHWNMKQYEGCTLHPDWYYLSNFAEWIRSWDDWRNKEIDKDIKYKGNKVYGPDTCIMVTKPVNNFFVIGRKLDDLPQGVCHTDNPERHRNKLYRAISRFDGKQKWGGYHSTIEEAYEAFRTMKFESLEILIEREQCLIVKQILQDIYETKNSPSLSWW